MQFSQTALQNKVAKNGALELLILIISWSLERWALASLSRVSLPVPEKVQAPAVKGDNGHVFLVTF